MGTRINRFRVVPQRMLRTRARAATPGLLVAARALDHAPARPVLRGRRLALMLALAAPALGLHLTSGDNRGVPHGTEATDGLYAARGDGRAGRAGAAPDRRRHRRAPAARSRPRRVAAERRLVAELRATRRSRPRRSRRPRARTPPAAARSTGRADSTANCARCQVRVGRAHRRRHESGAGDLVQRDPRPLHPGGRASRARTTVSLTGAPGLRRRLHRQGLQRFPWLVLAVLVITYLVLLRAFRSVVLPLKAVLMNLLSVGAAYGVLVLVFQHGVGQPLGLRSSSRRSKPGSRSSCSR